MHPTDEHDDTAPAMEMPRYKSHKTVWALEIESVHRKDPDPIKPTYRVTFRDAGYAPVDLPVDMWSRYNPVPGDFYVVYADGYKSFSPRKAFLDGYTPEGQSFREIKDGLKR